MRDEHFFIAELLEKYPDLNQEEREQFNQWLEQGNNKDFFNQILDKEILEEELRHLDELKIESQQRGSWEKLLQFRVKQQKPKIFSLTNWKIYAAAASVIIIAFVGIRWFGKKENIVTKETPTVVQSNDVSPGQYKAKLKLADGSEVILDSATNEVLVQQGGIRIVNKDGRLVYQKIGNQNEVLYNTLYTSKGESYATELSDGTRVWLNSQSSVRYPVVFNGDLRKVEITGEAYFEVAKNPKQPFTAMVNGMEVEVLGTHFNINSYADEPAMKTTLLEGKVRVRSVGTTAQTILEPGEQAILQQSGDNKMALVKTKDVDIEAEVAWRFGYFNFSNTDFKTLMRQLERWYDVEVIYQGDVPDIKSFGEIPRELSLSQVLNALQRPGLHFKVVDKKIVVLP